LKIHRSKSKTTDVSADIQRSPETVHESVASGDLSVSPDINLSVASTATIPESSTHVSHHDATPENFLTLSSLPLGSHLVLRCRKDWRDATITAIEPEKIVLSVGAPTGRTYRVRRPHDAPVFLDGSIPVLGEGAWRIGLARYDCRW
jgi:hypothetical protein